MTALIDRVTEEALSLPAQERAQLAEKLLTSLNAPIDEEIDQWWAEEAERRVATIDSGKARLVCGEEVFAKIRRKIGR